MGAFTYSIDPQLALTIVTISGGIDMKLMEELVKALSEDPNSDPRNRLLVNAEHTSWRPSLDELEGMVGLSGRISAFFQGGNALVVSGPVYEDLGNLFSTYARMKDINLSVFRDFDKAYEWLFPSDRESGPMPDDA